VRDELVQQPIAAPGAVPTNSLNCAVMSCTVFFAVPRPRLENRAG
jgi:hypothetical protein